MAKELEYGPSNKTKAEWSNFEAYEIDVHEERVQHNHIAMYIVKLLLLSKILKVSWFDSISSCFNNHVTDSYNFEIILYCSKRPKKKVVLEHDITGTRRDPQSPLQVFIFIHKDNSIEFAIT